jgi:hypothetical protein
MLVKQVSAFIENKAGRLNEIADVLAKSNIDISALSLADTTDYGIVRMIVCDPEKAVLALRESGVVCKITETLAIAIDDAPGGFAKGLKILTDNGIEIKYMYACISHAEGNALMILSVDDPEKADKLITSTDAGKVNPSEIYRHI